MRHFELPRIPTPCGALGLWDSKSPIYHILSSESFCSLDVGERQRLRITSEDQRGPELLMERVDRIARPIPGFGAGVEGLGRGSVAAPQDDEVDALRLSLSVYL